MSNVNSDPRPETQKELHMRLINSLVHTKELFTQLIGRTPNDVTQRLLSYIRTHDEAIQAEIEDYENSGYV